MGLKRSDWTPQMRAAMSRKTRERYDGKRQDPDEHTIYKVLCPQIRKSWTPQEERKRRQAAKQFTVPELACDYKFKNSNVL